MDLPYATSSARCARGVVMLRYLIASDRLARAHRSTRPRSVNDATDFLHLLLTSYIFTWALIPSGRLGVEISPLRWQSWMFHVWFSLVWIFWFIADCILPMPGWCVTSRPWWPLAARRRLQTPRSGLAWMQTPGQPCMDAWPDQGMDQGMRLDSVRSL